jgi:CheY-like chemotaxis protein
MRTALDSVLTTLGNNRDYLILGLAVLVLVEGGIIVLWARRAIRLQGELRQATTAAHEATRRAVEAAAAVDRAGALRTGDRPGGVTIRDGERKVYSVAGRTTPLVDLPQSAPATPAAPPPAPAARPAVVPSSAPPARVMAEWTPAAPEPPAEYVNPVAEQAAAWVIPDVEASHSATPDGPTPTPMPAAGNGWHPTEPTPTTLGWSGSTVPVEPAADFAVITDSAALATPPPSPAPAAHPNLTVLNGATPWVLPPVDDDDPPVDDLPTSGDILLVEDDPTIAKLYRVLLESRGYTVRYAGDGVEGLDRTNEKRPDLVLLDIMMPRMNGIAFLQALRAGDHRDVPVVVLSNFMEKQLVDDAMSLGAVEYMVKAQTRPEALVGALPHWLRGERAFSF